MLRQSGTHEINMEFAEIPGTSLKVARGDRYLGHRRMDVWRIAR